MFFKETHISQGFQSSHCGKYKWRCLTEHQLPFKPTNSMTNSANWGENLNSETSISTAALPTVHGE